MISQLISRMTHLPFRFMIKDEGFRLSMKIEEPSIEGASFLANASPFFLPAMPCLPLILSTGLRRLSPITHHFSLQDWHDLDLVSTSSEWALWYLIRQSSVLSLLILYFSTQDWPNPDLGVASTNSIVSSCQFCPWLLSKLPSCSRPKKSEEAPSSFPMVITSLSTQNLASFSPWSVKNTFCYWF